MEKWKTRYKNWDILTTKRAEASKAAYAVLIGQCSDAMKDRMKTYPQWAGIQSRLNIIGLLELIQTSMYAGTASKKPTLSYLEAESALQNYKQGCRNSNNNYLKVFRNKVEVYVHLGGEPGTSAARINSQLCDNGVVPKHATDRQIANATTEAKEEYLAGLFIKNCDVIRFAD